jgi:hypothetical protein
VSTRRDEPHFGDPLLFRFSPESHLSDIRALMDSYAVEVFNQSRLYIRCPLHHCGLDEGQSFSSNLFPAINWALEVRLCQWNPPVKDFLERIRERNTRWPFFVEYPLTIRLRIGDQWWEYAFSPGKTYEERRFVPEAISR